MHPFLARKINQNFFISLLTFISWTSIDMLLKLSVFFSVSTDYLLEQDNRSYIEVTGLTDTQLAHIQQIIKDITNTSSEKK